MILLHNPIGLEDFIVWAAGSILICYQLSKRYPWAVSLAFGFTVFSALRIFQVSLNGLPTDPLLRQLNNAAESALISFLLTVMIAQTLSIQTWVKVFKVVAVINALALCGHAFYIVMSGLIHHDLVYEWSLHEPWGILLNASMSGCLNAAIFPLFESKEKISKYLVLISVIAAGRSLPIAVLFSGLVALFYIKKNFRAVALIIPASLIVGYLVKGQNLFTTRGRDFIWRQALIFFRDHIQWALGSGLGGFYVLGPTFNDNAKGVFFIWLHSDWLQIFFEQGFIGFNLVVFMYLTALTRARSNAKLFATLVAYAVYGVANMPLRYPLAGLFGAILIRWATEYPGLPNARPSNT